MASNTCTHEGPCAHHLGPQNTNPYAAAPYGYSFKWRATAEPTGIYSMISRVGNPTWPSDKPSVSHIEIAKAGHGEHVNNLPKNLQATKPQGESSTNRFFVVEDESNGEHGGATEPQDTGLIPPEHEQVQRGDSYKPLGDRRPHPNKTFYPYATHICSDGYQSWSCSSTSHPLPVTITKYVGPKIKPEDVTGMHMELCTHAAVVGDRYQAGAAGEQAKACNIQQFHLEIHTRRLDQTTLELWLPVHENLGRNTRHYLAVSKLVCDGIVDQMDAEVFMKLLGGTPTSTRATCEHFAGAHGHDDDAKCYPEEHKRDQDEWLAKYLDALKTWTFNEYINLMPPGPEDMKCILDKPAPRKEPMNVEVPPRNPIVRLPPVDTRNPTRSLRDLNERLTGFSMDSNFSTPVPEGKLAPSKGSAEVDVETRKVTVNSPPSTASDSQTTSESKRAAGWPDCSCEQVCLCKSQAWKLGPSPPVPEGKLAASNGFVKVEVAPRKVTVTSPPSTASDSQTTSEPKRAAGWPDCSCEYVCLCKSQAWKL